MQEVGLALHVLSQALASARKGGGAIPNNAYQRLLEGTSPFARTRCHSDATSPV